MEEMCWSVNVHSCFIFAKHAIQISSHGDNGPCSRFECHICKDKVIEQGRAEDFRISVALTLIAREAREIFLSVTPKLLSAKPIFRLLMWH